MVTNIIGAIAVLVRRTLIVLACIAMVGCTSLQRIDAPPATLQDHLRAGGLVKAGDRIRVRTTDGNAHRFELVAIEAGQLRGRTTSIPIDEVAALERERFSVARTVLLVVGVTVVVLGIAVSSADLDGFELFGSSSASSSGTGG